MDFKNERLMMSKEEVINRAKELLNENQEVLITKYMFLEQQCKNQKEVIDKAIEFTNKKWGTWCTHHLEYMTELQNILKEVSE